MAGCVGTLGAECGAKGIGLTKSQRKDLGLQLTGNGQVGACAEEVLGEIDLAVLGHGDVVEIDGGCAEHGTGTLCVTGGDDGCVCIDKAALVEEAVDGKSSFAADAENSVEGIGSGAQVLDGTQVLHGVALLLQGVICRALALDQDDIGGQLNSLLGVGGLVDDTLDGDSCTDVQAGSQLVKLVLSRNNDLQVLDDRTVVELDEGAGLNVSCSSDPAAEGYLLAQVFFMLVKNFSYSNHCSNSLSVLLKDNWMQT